MLTGRLVQEAAVILFIFFLAFLSLAHRQQSSSVFDLTEPSSETLGGANPYSIQALEEKKKK